MKKLNRALALLLTFAIMVSLFPVPVRAGDAGQSNPLSGTYVSVRFEPTTAFVGQEVSLYIKTAHSSTVGEDHKTQKFRVDLTGWDSAVLANSFSAQGVYPWSQGDRKVEFHLKKDSGTNNSYIEYTLNAGDSFDIPITFTTLNGVSGNHAEITATPRIVDIQSKPKDVLYVEGQSATATWDAYMGWNLEKKITSVNKELKIENGRITGGTPVHYVIDATNLPLKQAIEKKGKGDSEARKEATKDREDIGRVFTEQVHFTDTLTLPAGLTLPKDVFFSKEDKKVVTAEGKPLFELTILPIGYQNLTFDISNNGKITYSFDVPNNETYHDLPNQRIEANFYPQYLAGINQVSGDQVERLNVLNEVTFTATPVDKYNDNIQPITLKDDAVFQIIPEKPNVGFVKTANNDAATKGVKAGDKVSYTLTLTNDASVAATGKTITDTLPAGMYLTETQIKALNNQLPSGVTVKYEPNTITWSNVTVPARTTADNPLTFTYEATVKTTGELKALGITGVPELDNKASYNGEKSASVTVPLKPSYSTDKGLSQILKPNGEKFVEGTDKLEPGCVIEYELSYTNTSSVDVTYLHLEDQMGHGLVPLYESTDGETTKYNVVQDNCNDEEYTIGGSKAAVNGSKWYGGYTIAWNLDLTSNPLKPEETRTMKVRAKISDVQNLPNTLTNSFGEAHYDIEYSPSNYMLDKKGDVVFADKDTASVLMRYELTVTNKGSTTLNGIWLTDNLPRGLVPVSVTDEANGKYTDITDERNTGKLTLSCKDETTTSEAAVTMNDRYQVRWTVDDLAGGKTRTYILYARVDYANLEHSNGVVYNRFNDEKGTTYGETSIPVPTPVPEISKTFDESTNADKKFKPGDKVTFNLNYEITNFAAVKYILRDQLPNAYIPLRDGMGEETVDARRITESGEYMIGGHLATVTFDKDQNNSTLIEWNLTKEQVLPAGAKGSIKLETLLKPDSEMPDSPSFKNTLVDNFYTWKDVTPPIDANALLDFDKKIIDPADGQEKVELTTPIKRGETVTFVLRLINTSTRDRRFIYVSDQLPTQTYDKFKYTLTPGDSKNAYIQQFESPNKTYTHTDKEGNKHELTVVPRGVQPEITDNGTNLKWKWKVDNTYDAVVVPARSAMEWLVTITYPSDEATWNSFVRAAKDKGPGYDKIWNTLWWNGNAKKVIYPIDMGEPALYMQKGVYHLTDTPFEKYTTNSEFNSAYHYKGKDGKAVVVYYVGITNPSLVAVPLLDATDVLPKGLTYKGMLLDGNWAEHSNILNANVYNVQSQHSSHFAKATGDGFTWSEDIKVVRTGYDTSSNTLVFDFLNKHTNQTYVLEPGKTLSFAYVCEIDASAERSSTNSFSLRTQGNVKQQNVGMTKDKNDSIPPNDGGCSRSYSDNVTTFTSNVTILGGEILPGVRKTLVKYLPKLGSTITSPDRGISVTDRNAKINAGDSLVWEIDIYNNGSTDMALDYLYDVIEFPYVMSDNPDRRPVLTYNGRSFTPTFTHLRTDGDKGKESESNTYKMDLSKLVDGNPLTIKPGAYATLMVVTDNPSGGLINGKERYNTVKLKPVKEFTHVYCGKPVEENDEQLITDDAHVKIIQGFHASSYKKVEEVKTRGNYALGTTHALDERYITLTEGNREVLYTLNVTNKCQSAMDKLVLIDNLPHRGDRGPEGASRGSAFEVSLLGDGAVEVSLKGEYNTDYTPLEKSQYQVTYSTKADGFTKADYRGETSNWHASAMGAKSIRIEITGKDEYGTGIIKSGDSIRVTFKAQVPTGKPTGIAWNNFGYYYKAGEDHDNYAAPSMVGVAVVKPTTADFRFRKVDESDLGLSGAKFTLISLSEAGSKDAVPLSATSDAYGAVTFEKLLPGTYILREVEAPAGCTLPTGHWKVTIPDEQGGAITVAYYADDNAAEPSQKDFYTPSAADDGATLIHNKARQVEVPELPSVGGSGTQWMMLGGALVMLMVIALLAANKQKGKA